MSKDVKISPLGNLMISLYKYNRIDQDITLQLLKEYGEKLLKPENIRFLSDRVYEKSLIYMQTYKEYQKIVGQRKENAKSKFDKGSFSIIEKKKIIYDKALNELRQALNGWFYSLGSRSPNKYCETKRRPIYSCTVPDIKSLAMVSNNISSIIKSQNEAKKLFSNILIYSSGGILDDRFNSNGTSSDLACFVKKIFEYIIPLTNELEIPLFDSKVNTLYIYNGIIGCFRDKHHLAGVNALVSTANELTVLLNATYCANCNRFYISYAEYNYYMERYKSLLTRFVLNESMQTNGAFGGLADKSPLKLCGYSVSQEKGLTQKEREYILYEMISSGIVSKPEAMQYIEWFIHFNGNREINHLARSKWESDLNYVRNLNLANQPNQKMDAIKPYRK